MRKLRLHLDELAVESFDTAKTPADARGTVHANSAYNTCQWSCQCETTHEPTGYGQETCDGYQTCGVWGGYGNIPEQIC